MKPLYAVVFESVGKGILSLCFGAVLHMKRKGLVIFGFLRQSKRRKKQRYD